jgi:hypothetical protein
MYRWVFVYEWLEEGYWEYIAQYIGSRLLFEELVLQCEKKHDTETNVVRETVVTFVDRPDLENEHAKQREHETGWMIDGVQIRSTEKTKQRTRR